jgi:hypothetical protein
MLPDLSNRGRGNTLGDLTLVGAGGLIAGGARQLGARQIEPILVREGSDVLVERLAGAGHKATPAGGNWPISDPIRDPGQAV